MDIRILLSSIVETTADAAIVTLFEAQEPQGATAAIDAALEGAIKELISGGDLAGKSDQLATLYPRGHIPARRLLVVGLGKPEAFDLDAIRRAAGLAASRARDLGAKTAVMALPDDPTGALALDRMAQAAVEGAILALYEYPAERQKPDEDRKQLDSLSLLVPSAESVAPV